MCIVQSYLLEGKNRLFPMETEIHEYLQYEYSI